MIKKIFLSVVAITTLLSTGLIFSPNKVNAFNFGGNEIKPMAEIFHCDGPYKEARVVSSNNREISERTGNYYSPGSTFTLAKTTSFTVENDASIVLIPEIFSLGYKESATSSVSVGWSKTNNSNVDKELVIFKVYDLVELTSYVKHGSDSCKVGSVQRYKLYTGSGYDLN